MKRILLLASLLAFAAGCAKTEIETAVTTVGETVPQGNATFTAVIADAAKASVDPSSGKFAWQAGDAVSVWVTGGSEGRFVTFTLVGTGGEASGKFSGTLAEGEAMTDFAVYPAGAHKYSGGTLSVNYPSEFAWTEGVVPTVMVAQIAAGSESMSFRHVGGVVSVTVDNVPASATKFSFQAPASTGITGDFVYDGTQVAASGEAADEVTVTFPAGTASQMTFYIPVPVVTLSGLTVSLATDSHTIAKSVKTATASNIVSRATLLKMPAYTVPGPVFYVKADNNTGDGSSWDKATTLTKALAMAEDGDEVRVAAGTYVPDTQLELESGGKDDHWKTFLVGANFKVVGGYPAAGGDTADPSNETILDAYGAYHALVVSCTKSAADSVELHNLVLTGGVSSGTAVNALDREGKTVSNKQGAAMISLRTRILMKDCTVRGLNETVGSAIYNVTSANLTIDGCKFHDNTAGGSGLVYNNYNLYIRKSSFKDNTCAASGGALRNNSRMEVYDCLISGNKANDGTADIHGGAIYNTGTLYMERDTLTNNTGKMGGAIYNQGDITFHSGLVKGNTGSSYGGAYYSNGGGTADFNDVVFDGNTGTRGGAAYIRSANTTTVTRASYTNCRLLNHVYDSNGPCIWNDGSHLVVDGCYFSGNKGKIGAALYNYPDGTKIAGYTYVYNSEFTGNTATSRGIIYLREYSKNVFVNCSVHDNTASAAGGGISCYSNSENYLVGCTICSNYAGTIGGGFELLNNNTVVHLYNTLISGNAAETVNANTGSCEDFSYPDTKRLTACVGSIIAGTLYSDVDTPVSGWTFNPSTMFGTLTSGVYPVVSVLSGGVETNPAMAQGMGKTDLQAINPGFSVGSIDAAKLGVDIAGNERSGKVIGAYVGQ